jgi:tetraacyldisaccharide 4'-kinase
MHRPPSLESLLLDLWYGPRGRRRAWPLLPLSGLFRVAAEARRWGYRHDLLPSERPPVPVLVVGNLGVGGTGKTPCVLWLVQRLLGAGLHPGVVSRGYGARPGAAPRLVTADSDPRLVGDEPLLLARRCGCPVAVHPSRPAAARLLVAQAGCDCIVADDGLQHYALGRDIEIGVLDGERRFGNGWCLPAGPLREPRRRWRTLDLRIVTGAGESGAYRMDLVPGAARNLADPSRSRPLEAFRGSPVHAAAGIGHPQRFFAGLRERGLTIDEQPFPDHFPFRAEDLRFPDQSPVLMTDKDGVKYAQYADPRHWTVPVQAHLPEAAFEDLMALLRGRHLLSDTTKNDG